MINNSGRKSAVNPIPLDSTSIDEEMYLLGQKYCPNHNGLSPLMVYRKEIDNFICPECMYTLTKESKEQNAEQQYHGRIRTRTGYRSAGGKRYTKISQEEEQENDSNNNSINSGVWIQPFEHGKDD